MAKKTTWVCDVCNAELGEQEPVNAFHGTRFQVSFPPMTIDVCRNCAETRPVKDLAQHCRKWPEEWADKPETTKQVAPAQWADAGETICGKPIVTRNGTTLRCVKVGYHTDECSCGYPDP